LLGGIGLKFFSPRRTSACIKLARLIGSRIEEHRIKFHPGQEIHDCQTFLGVVKFGMLLSYEELRRLGHDGVNRLIDYIKTCPGARVKSLSQEEFGTLTNYQKSLFLHTGGSVKHKKISRAEFDKMSPRKKAEFMKKGGKLE
jgi:hypothetical protein